MVVGTLKVSLDQLNKEKKKKTNTKRSFVECCSVSCCELCVMLACASRSSTKATVAKTVFVE